MCSQASALVLAQNLQHQQPLFSPLFLARYAWVGSGPGGLSSLPCLRRLRELGGQRLPHGTGAAPLLPRCCIRCVSARKGGSVLSVIWLRGPAERCENVVAITALGFLPGWDETFFIARKHTKI